MMTPINITIETASQKKILEFLIKDRQRVNDRAIRVNKDTILAEYYHKQQQDLDYLYNQLNK
jgi:hypothetical protein